MKGGFSVLGFLLVLSACLLAVAAKYRRGVFFCIPKQVVHPGGGCFVYVISAGYI